MISKLKNSEEIKKILRKRNKKVVLCHGTFDLLHLGHINHLSEAKSFGDILVVSVTSDKFVNKGPGRPFFTSKQRAEALSALKQVDYVFINKDFTSSKIIKFLNQIFIVKAQIIRKIKMTLQVKLRMKFELQKVLGERLFIQQDQLLAQVN